MTPTHTRNKQYRNLYRATPLVTLKEEKQATWEKETRKLVDAAHKDFWKRRGIKPPFVSHLVLGCYELPSSKEVHHVS